MQRRSPVVKRSDRIHRKLLERAMDDPFFVGWALAGYQRVQGFGTVKLTDLLRCTPEAIDRIALCRLPDHEKGNIASDVLKIASFGPCDPEALLSLIRTTVSVHILQGAAVTSEKAPGDLLMAARDRIEMADDKREGESDGQP